jgi:hypothetical protein
MQDFLALLSVFVFAAVCILGALYIQFRGRELDHKEKLAAIEKGVDLPVPRSAPWTPRTYLLRGMIWLFVGLTALVALCAIAVTSRRPLSIEVRIAAVNDARSRGATEEELQMLRNAPGVDEGMPIGIGFLGLIPVGVGVAYLVFYRVESKKLVS